MHTKLIINYPNNKTRRFTIALNFNLQNNVKVEIFMPFAAIISTEVLIQVSVTGGGSHGVVVFVSVSLILMAFLRGVGERD